MHAQRIHTLCLLMDALTMHRHAARLSRAVLHCDSQCRTHSTCFLHMQRIQSRTSDACTAVYVSLLKGTALVVFSNGGTYHYRNVSRRAIANLLLNPNMSLGFWVNNNCLTERTSVGQRWNAAPCVG